MLNLACLLLHLEYAQKGEKNREKKITKFLLSQCDGLVFFQMKRHKPERYVIYPVLKHTLKAHVQETPIAKPFGVT